MSLGYFPTSYNTNSKEVIGDFNSSDFNQNYESVEAYQLLDYANLYNTNTFTSNNYFTNIFVQSLNSISYTVLGFLTNITSDVQSQFNSLLSQLNNLLPNVFIFYDLPSNTTSITDNVYLNSLATPNNSAISGNCSISGNLNVNNINNISLTTQNINVGNTIQSNIIICNSIQSKTDIGCYLFLNTITIPIMKSQNNTSLFLNLTNPINFYIHLKQNYTVIFLDINKNVIATETNNTNDFIYNINISLISQPYYINLYLNNILL